MVISSNPFLDRLNQRKQQENLPIEEIPIDVTENPFEKRKEQRKPEKFKQESELIWDDSGDIEREVERGTAQATSRVLESALGTPGNIQSMIKEITGLQVGPQLPTSSDIREFSEKATKGYTKPKSKFEEKGGEILSDITNMALPGGSSYGVLRNIGIPVAGFLAGEGLERISGSEQFGQYGKMGLMFLLDLAKAFKDKGRGGAKRYARELWKEGEQNIPKGVSVNATDLSNKLSVLKKELKKGGASPQTEKALEKIGHLESQIKNGKIPVDELVATRTRINNLIDAQGGFDFTTPTATRQGSIFNLNQVKDEVINVLDEYGKINPAFGIPYNQGNQAYNVYHSSNAASKFLNKYFADYLRSPLLHKLFGVSLKGAAGVIAPYQAIKLIYRVIKSPVLAELYGNVVKAALKNDVPVAAKNLEKLKSELEKSETIPEDTRSKSKK